jgi:predicted acylesterase/phospholipase RssA
VNEKIRTQHFINCLGVFEGGGVRTAAFAGAYEAAIEAGIGFSDVAGTSGGSIAAALVATGATPDAIWQKVQSLDFAKLTTGGPDKRQRLSDVPNRFKRCVAWMASSEYRKVSPFVMHGGLYDSQAIEDWVEDVLCDLLKLKSGTRKISFDDLPIPLYVVASDLGSREPKVWSKHQTPQDSVALAVRCSCAIPFFFQPVRSGGTTYVDGGVLSKMPSFVFAYGDAPQHTRRILTFRLHEAPGAKKDLDSPQGLVAAIVDTVVDGASKIQRGLQPTQFFVDVDTGNVSSTNFQLDDVKKQFLYDQGAAAVRKFVRNEREELAKVRPADRYFGRDEKFLFYVQSFRNCNSELIISSSTSDWLYWLFPALLQASKRGVFIRYVTIASSNSEETRCQRLLKAIGVYITVVEELPYRGLVCDPTSTTASVAVTTGQGHQNEETRLYTNGDHSSIVQLLIKALQLREERHTVQKFFSDRPCSDGELFGLLKAVPQYQHAEFAFEKVKFDESLHGTQTFVKEFKYAQIDWMCNGRDVPMLQPTWIDLNGSGVSTLTIPPVVEKSGDGLYIIEGHVRALQCLRRGMESFDAVVVRNARESLPVKSRPFGQITLESKTVPKSEQFPDHVDSRWRYIERDVRNAHWTNLDKSAA